MSWGKFFVITAGLLVFLWLMFCYVYGIFVLNDTIVPYPGTEIDEWLNEYYISGLISSLLGFVCSAVWFSIGNSYDGKSSLGIKFGIIWIVSIVFSVAVKFLVMPDFVEGAGLASVFIILLAPLLYYLSSLFAPANASKYIPPLSGLIH